MMMQMQMCPKCVMHGRGGDLRRVRTVVVAHRWMWEEGRCERCDAGVEG